MDASRLGAYYHRHHVERNRYGFSINGAERGSVFAGWIGRGHEVLDIGCRDGTLTRYYASGNRITGVDIDTEALDRAKREIENVGCFSTDSFDINDGFPYSDHSFDRIMMGEVLEHTVFPDQVVQEVFRCLRPGGWFMGSIPNAFRLKNRLQFLFGRDFEVDPTHLHHFHPDAVRRMFREAGFEQIEILPIGGRYSHIHPSLFGLSLLWRCCRPEDPAAESIEEPKTP